jgi:hypothetical protein
MNNPHRFSRNEGMALLLTMIFLVGMILMATGLGSRVINQSRQVDNYVDYQECFEGLEAALAHAKYELKQRGKAGEKEDEDGMIGVEPDYDFESGLPNFGMKAVTPWKLETLPNIEYFAYTFAWEDDGIDNNGDGIVDGPEEEDFFTVYSVARGANSLRRAETILGGSNVNIWNNAIFAGDGQVGNLINGNVSIHGSVHLLGADLGPGDLAVAAIDLSGTALIHNNYQGIPAALAARVPPLPKTVFDGETVNTLNAKLRVKRGLVGVSGNSEIGEPHVRGNAFKETMDGIFVNDGWTGNGLKANGLPKNAWSDNGLTETYDLGDAVPFPTFANDGGRNHLAYYLQTDPIGTGFQVVKNGDMTIRANQNYYWNATLGVEVVNQNLGAGGMPALATLNNNHNYIWFDATANRMVVNGRIAVNGNVTFDRGSGNDNTFNYSGKGAILAYDASGAGVKGNMNLLVNLLTVNADGTTANSYPHNNLLGWMAEKNLTIGNNAQLSVMGGFYAQGTVSVNKQTNIMGTIVGNNFNMGTNVPDIYQVPELTEAWTLGMRMIGSGKILTYEPISWRELGLT